MQTQEMVRRDTLGYRKTFGVVAPSTNTSVQPEYDDFRPRGVTNHFARIDIPNDPVHSDADFDQLMKNIRGSLEEAIARGTDLDCDVAICGVDNNPARVAASYHFSAKHIPVIFTAVSRDADHGYVFVEERGGPCIACLFPDMVNDDRYPCPGTPAIADILQAVGAFAVYAVDTLLMKRSRTWNYRRLGLSDASLDGGSMISKRGGCSLCSHAVT